MKITTAKEAIEALGGARVIAALFGGLDRRVVSNWSSRKYLPPHTAPTLAPMLKASGYEFPPSLFGKRAARFAVTNDRKPQPFRRP